MESASSSSSSHVLLFLSSRVRQHGRQLKFVLPCSQVPLLPYSSPWSSVPGLSSALGLRGNMRSPIAFASKLDTLAEVVIASFRVCKEARDSRKARCTEAF
ncbi:hypothetical protein VPH35_066693 [Triticum aestivum]